MARAFPAFHPANLREINEHFRTKNTPYFKTQQDYEKYFSPIDLDAVFAQAVFWNFSRRLEYLVYSECLGCSSHESHLPHDLCLTNLESLLSVFWEKLVKDTVQEEIHHGVYQLPLWRDQALVDAVYDASKTTFPYAYFLDFVWRQDRLGDPSLKAYWIAKMSEYFSWYFGNDHSLRTAHLRLGMVYDRVDPDRIYRRQETAFSNTPDSSEYDPSESLFSGEPASASTGRSRRRRVSTLDSFSSPVPPSSEGFDVADLADFHEYEDDDDEGSGHWQTTLDDDGDDTNPSAEELYLSH